MAIPAEVQTELENISTKTGEFMKVFTQQYLSGFVMSTVNAKVDGAVSAVMDDAKGEQKIDLNSTAIGVQVMDRRNVVGLDFNKHTVYRLCAVRLQPKKSRLVVVTRRFPKMNDLYQGLNKELGPNMPAAEFPKRRSRLKRAFHDKDKDQKDFLKQREDGLRSWFESANAVDAIATHDEWLKFFDLIDDPDRNLALEQFREALGSTGEEMGFDVPDAVDDYEDEEDMLTACMIEILKVESLPNIRAQVSEKVPGPLQKKVTSKVESTVGKTVSTTIKAAWAAAKDAVAQARKAVMDVLDQNAEPVVSALRQVRSKVQELADAKMGAMLGNIPGIGRSAPPEETPTRIQLASVHSLASLRQALDSDAKVSDAFDQFVALCEKTYKPPFANKGRLVYDLGELGNMGIKVPGVSGILKAHEKCGEALCLIWYNALMTYLKGVQRIVRYKDDLENSVTGGKPCDANAHKAQLRELSCAGGFDIVQANFKTVKDLKKQLKGVTPEAQAVIYAVQAKVPVYLGNALGEILAGFNVASNDSAGVRGALLGVLEPQALRIMNEFSVRSLNALAEATSTILRVSLVEQASAIVDEAIDALGTVMELMPQALQDQLDLKQLVNDGLNKALSTIATKCVGVLQDRGEKAFYEGF